VDTNLTFNFREIVKRDVENECGGRHLEFDVNSFVGRLRGEGVRGGLRMIRILVTIRSNS